MLQRRTANAVIDFFDTKIITEVAEVQTEAEYIRPQDHHELSRQMHEIESKLRMQDRYLKEVAEDVNLKNRSLEWVITERNSEREENTDLKVRSQNLAMDLNVAIKKFEDSNRKLSDSNNKILVMRAEKARTLEVIRVHETKIDFLQREAIALKLQLDYMDKAKAAAEEQMSKALKRLSLASTKAKPVEIVNKHRPKSSSGQNSAKMTLRRNKSHEVVGNFEEVGKFIETYWKDKASIGTSKRKKAQKRKLTKLKTQGGAKGLDSDASLDDLGHSTQERRRRRVHDADLSSDGSQLSEFITMRTDSRSSHTHDKGNPRTSKETSSSRWQRPLNKFEASSPRSSEHGSHGRESRGRADIKTNKPGKETSQVTNILSTVHNSPVLGRDELDRLATDDRQWTSRVGPVEEDLAEENEGLAYNGRSIESITTTSSQGESGRRVLNGNGQVITLLDKQTDIIELLLKLADETSKSSQFNCDDPDMQYGDDGTAVSSGGEARFYLPFNPNVVFGLRGDVFYHTLFQVFQCNTRGTDGSSHYVPPYKLHTAGPVAKPSIKKRNPVKPPLHEGCSRSCQHFSKDVRPKYREDMVLPLKIQDLGL